MNGNEKNSPLVSIIMNCYNGEEYLKEAIDSVFNQTYNNWEIIFWDNNSIDKSANIAKSYGSKLIYYKSEVNTSLGEARNSAIKVCKGEYIAFLDVDDIWFESKLEIQIKKMIQDNTSLSYTGCLLGLNIETSSRFIPHYNTGFIFGQLLQKFEINLPTAVIKHSVIYNQGINFNKLIIASEEYDLFVKIASTYKVSVIKEPTCFYRISSNSLTNKSIEHRANDRIITLASLRRSFKNIVDENIKFFNNAKYKIWYYKFQFSLYSNNINDAILNIKKIRYKDLRYFFIYIIVIINPKIYKKILKIYDKRGF